MSTSKDFLLEGSSQRLENDTDLQISPELMKSYEKFVFWDELGTYFEDETISIRLRHEYRDFRARMGLYLTPKVSLELKYPTSISSPKGLFLERALAIGKSEENFQVVLLEPGKEEKIYMKMKCQDMFTEKVIHPIFVKDRNSGTSKRINIPLPVCFNRFIDKEEVKDKHEFFREIQAEETGFRATKFYVRTPTTTSPKEAIEKVKKILEKGLGLGYHETFEKTIVRKKVTMLGTFHTEVRKYRIAIFVFHYIDKKVFGFVIKCYGKLNEEICKLLKHVLFSPDFGFVIAYPFETKDLRERIGYILYEDEDDENASFFKISLPGQDIELKKFMIQFFF